MKHISSEAQFLASQQHGLLNRLQLKSFGVRDVHIRSAIGAGYMSPLTSKVLAIGVPTSTRDQQLMLVHLHYPDVLLTGRSALETFGFPGKLNDRIDFISTRYIRNPPISYWHPHGRETITRHPQSLNLTENPVAVVDAMRFARTDKEASFIAVWCLQRQIVNLPDLALEVERTLSIAGTDRVRRVLKLLKPGINAVSELEFDGLCKKYRVPAPTRQSLRRDSEGRARYLDAVWERSNRTLAVEVDGLGHLDYQVRADDMFRDNSMMLSGITTIRIPAQELRRDPQRWMLQIADALQLNH